jgi:hypothetical protein
MVRTIVLSADCRFSLTATPIRVMDRHDRKLKPSAQALQKGYFMHRFTFLAGIALLCVPVHAAGKPKPPTITLGRTDSGSFDGVATDSVGPRHFSFPLKFDPVFNPWNRQERKEWELIHGKYDQ